MNTLVYPAGKALILTTGEYSDFGVAAVLVTLKECDLPALAKQYHAINGKPDTYCHNVYDFPTWLVTQGYAFPAETEEVHLGSYDTFDRELVGG